MFGTDIRYIADYWDRQTQYDVIAAISDIIVRAPFFKPVMPHSGRPWSIEMSNAGILGWVSDKQGYRYQTTHPHTGAIWPPIPDILLNAWDALTAYPAPPEACLINYYATPQAKMGLHQDKDETALDAPILSFSLGDSALFRMGGTTRRGATKSLKLHSGDAFLFGGTARLNFHGISRIYAGSSQILRAFPPFACGGRINLTLRRVNRL